MSTPFRSYVTGRVVDTHRHGNTVYGNPIYSVTLDNGQTYRISDNASLNYGIANAEYRDVPHVFDLTRAGRISGYTRSVPEHVARSGDSVARTLRSGQPGQ